MSKAPNPNCSRRAGWRLAWSTPPSVCECVNEWVNVRQYCNVLWMVTGNALYKCSPFTIIFKFCNFLSMAFIHPSFNKYQHGLQRNQLFGNSIKECSNRGPTHRLERGTCEETSPSHHRPSSSTSSFTCMDVSEAATGRETCLQAPPPSCRPGEVVHIWSRPCVFSFSRTLSPELSDATGAVWYQNSRQASPPSLKAGLSK